MERGVLLADIQTAPRNCLILLVGPPGARKSTFCHQVVLNGLAMDRPVIFVTTEQRPAQVISDLRERGLGGLGPGAISYVDAFSQTVGVAAPEQPDAIQANCMDLNSISIAITKLQERMGPRGILLALDSLTSPYLFGGAGVVKFMRLFLSRFAAEGSSVVALIDEGCGRPEDLVTMMSIADGVIKIEIDKDRQVFNVVKHPQVAPTTMKTPMTRSTAFDLERMDPSVLAGVLDWIYTQRPGKPIRSDVPDVVNLFWLNLAAWSGMLWDPKRFPAIAYESIKKMELTAVDALSSVLPWHRKLLMNLLMPKSFSEVKDMRRLSSRFLEPLSKKEGLAVWKYLEDASKTDEHYFRLYESASCWGFDDVRARLGHLICGATAGMLKAVEMKERDWNIVETECMGAGSPYCEFKAVPGQTDELGVFLRSIDSSAVEKVHDRLMDQLVGLLVRGEPLAQRPGLGNGVHFILVQDCTSTVALFSERYRMALRMGGAKAGKEVGEHLMEAGVMGDEAIRRVMDFLAYCQVGKIVLGETIRIRENCEAFGLVTGEPSCFFTTGFLNGLFSAIKSQQVREIGCIAAGDPYCEWEII